MKRSAVRHDRPVVLGEPEGSEFTAGQKTEFIPWAHGFLPIVDPNDGQWALMLGLARGRAPKDIAVKSRSRRVGPCLLCNDRRVDVRARRRAGA